MGKSSDYLYEIVVGKSMVRNQQRKGRERERDERINEVRDGVQKRIKNGVGWKWPLDMTPENLGINGTKKRQSK